MHILFLYPYISAIFFILYHTTWCKTKNGISDMGFGTNKYLTSFIPKYPYLSHFLNLIYIHGIITYNVINTIISYNQRGKS